MSYFTRLCRLQDTSNANQIHCLKIKL
uniref:Uncharacterized protein n=1 Tax=Anguilla anguilla TaxID=7936 RepID=A0A0E9QL39_ANGAN